MTTITDRIYKFIEKEGVSISEFSRKIGVSSGYFSKQKANKANIGSQIIEKIVREYPNINPTWLLLGEGSMRPHVSPNKFDKIFAGLSEIEKIGIDKYIDNQIVDSSEYITHGAPLLDRLIKMEGANLTTNKYQEIEGNTYIVSLLIRDYCVSINMIEYIKQYIKNELPMQDLKDMLRKKIEQQQELYDILLPYEKVLSELNDIVLNFDKKHNNFFHE